MSLGATGWACRQPTDIDMTITTEGAHCASDGVDASVLNGVSIVLTGDGTQTVTATTPQQCAQTTPPFQAIGNTYIKPKDSAHDNEIINIRLAAAIDNTSTDTCSTDQGAAGAGCFIAHRVVAFSAHDELSLPVNLDVTDVACLGKICDPASTCFRGDCVDAAVSCQGTRCGVTGIDMDAGTSDDLDANSPTPDAGIDSGLDATIRDAANDGDASDATMAMMQPDANAPVDAGVDANEPVDSGVDPNKPVDASVPTSDAGSFAIHLAAAHQFTCATMSTELRCWGLSSLTPHSATIPANTSIFAGYQSECVVGADAAVCSSNSPIGNGAAVGANDIVFADGMAAYCFLKGGGLSCPGETAPITGTFTQIALSDTSLCGLSTSSISCAAFGSSSVKNPLPSGVTPHNIVGIGGPDDEEGQSLGGGGEFCSTTNSGAYCWTNTLDAGVFWGAGNSVTAVAAGDFVECYVDGSGVTCATIKNGGSSAPTPCNFSSTSPITSDIPSVIVAGSNHVCYVDPKASSADNAIKCFGDPTELGQSPGACITTPTTGFVTW